MVFSHLSVHRPHPEARDALVASMHRYGAAIADAPGLVSVHTFEDAARGTLIGLAIWESEDAFHASVGLARDAVADDPFDEWEAAPVDGYRLTEV
ncbi:MAG: antibiotic biosynthesis monooxygenase [Propionicimonas sp.]|uniref:antibiotic biosynthesis monooxygenase n=1 Tax=Propionicimonas sp. TaxID=1955623 RepID=UPI003D122058